MNLMLRLIQGVIDMKLMLSWAVTSGALILIVLAVRVLFRNKLSARLRYALWGVVLLRLLVPFQVVLPAAASDALPLLASNLAQDVTPRLDDTMLYAIPTEEQPYGLPAGMPPEYIRNGSPDSVWDRFSGGVVYDGEHITRYAFMMTALEVVVLIWLAGTALAALVILTSNLRFARRLRKRRERLEVPDAPIPVYVAEGLPSPCLFGVFRPAVYVTPEAAEDPDTLRHVLAHELTHHAHFDHLWSLLRCLALALHWYNPLVWLAVGLSKQDGELACDEGAVARLGEAERIPYGRTLVDMVAARSLRPGDLLSCSTAMTGGGKSVKQRVAQLVKKPETVRTALFAVIALVALGLVFTFAGRKPAPVFEAASFAQYQADLESAASVLYTETRAFSDEVFDPITDGDILNNARRELAEFTPVEELDPADREPDLSRAVHAPRVTLSPAAGDGRTYTLLLSGDYTYLLTPGDYVDAQYYTILARSAEKTDVPAFLLTLSRTQNNRNQTGSGSPELDRFFTELESAQRIGIGNPSISSVFEPGNISDPETLAQAKELLSKTTPAAYLEDVGWDVLSLDSNHPPEYITQEELERQFLIGGHPLNLFPTLDKDMETAHRCWLVWTEDCVLLTQWFPEREENTVEILAALPADTIIKLKELARTNGTSRPEEPASLYVAPNEESDRVPLAAVIGGMSFSDLPPGEEQVSEQAFFIPEDISSISYSLTYVRPILTLEFGLRSADGKKYSCSQEANGGVANGTFEDIPAGSYQIFVRNMGDLNDYTQFPYQPESVSDDATGAVNFQITK